MDCPGCGKANRSDARFCKYCGVALETRCAACGAELDADARFCDACGALVKAGTDRDAPVAAARKVVTVLFADLTGSTALEENLDAESVRSLVDRFYAALRKEVEQRSGRVVKFTGDGLMAAFGVPDVREDDAVRAVDTALAMCAACERLADEIGNPQIALKVGVNTGEVVVIEDDDDVVGDAVNIAARLEGAAQAGEVLVGEETWRSTRATSRYEPIEPLVLKGKAEPVTAYRLLSVDEAPETASAPFVGREHEIERLLTVFDDAVAANAARVVTIVGSPGLGKTRLAREFVERLGERARTRETRCDPAGSTTFAPIADALRAASAIPDDADEATIVAALADRVPSDDPDRDRIATLAGAILGAGAPGSTEETFWAVRRMLEIAATERPAVLVLDDLHWAEPMLLDLVEHLAEWIREAPVLLVCTARPELRDMRPSLVEGGRLSSVIALEGLDETETARLALGLLGTHELPAELLNKIPVSTHGNPLFVRELVRMLVDDGVLVRTADGWTVTVDVEGIEVPPTIQSLLAARIDRLRPDERTIVELASVIGKEFYGGALRALAPVTVHDQIDACLEGLRRKEIVEPAGTYWIDEPVYRFHHVLIRDAAYRRVLKETRAELHQRVADWLQRKTADVLGEHDELIGYHLEQAHEYLRQLGRSDDELGRRAAAPLGEAARRALDRDDLPAAAALSGRALDRLPADDPSRPDLLLVGCESLLSMGDVAAGRRAVDELERLADTSRLAAWATCFSGQLANLTAPERLQEIEKRVASAAAELAELGDAAGAAKAHTVHGATLARLGRFADCEAALDDALTAAREAGDRRRITAVLGSAPLAALWGPSPVSRAGGRCLDLVRLSRITTASPAVEATSLRCQAVLEALRGRADAARRMLRGARRTLEELGLEHELLETDQFAGIVDLIDGEATAAQAHLRGAHEGFIGFGVDVLAAQTAALLARTHLLLGEDEDAERFASESERLGGQDLKASIAWRAVRAELLARRGDVDEARRLAESAVELAAKTDALIDHGDACRALAAVCTAARDHDGARAALDRAFALYERKGATALIERAEASSPATPAHPAASELSLENACTRVGAQMVRLFSRRDWEAMAPIVDADLVHEDRRRGLRDERRGDLPTDLAELGVTRIEGNVLAIRGDRLALSHLRFLGDQSQPGVFEAEILLSQELNELGRLARQVVFEPDDLGAALEHLDERFLAGEGEPHRELVQTMSAVTRCFTDADWERAREILAEDAVVVDHRPASLGEIHGGQAWIDSTRELRNLIGYRGDVVAYHRFASDRAACLVRYRGQTDDGAVVETAFHFVFEVRDKRVARGEIFPEDRLDDALARFDALDHEDAGVAVENDASIAARGLYAALLDRDWDRFRALLRDDCSIEDRRQGFGMRSVGIEGMVKVGEAILSVGPQIMRWSTIATRGDRLAIGTVLFGGFDSPYEVELIQLAEIDEEGLLRDWATWDLHELDAAMADLDERFVGGEGAAHKHLVMPMARFARAFSVGDWDALREGMEPDAVVLDHRPLRLGEVHGAEAWIETAVAIRDLVPYTAHVIRYHCFASDTAACAIRYHGTTAEGAEVETLFNFVFKVRDGRMVRMEPFPIDHLDAALARLAQVADRSGALENAATRALTGTEEAFARRDWEALGSLFADDCFGDDRRAGLRAEIQGRAGVISNMQAIASLGPIVYENIPLAIRGERLTLSSMILTSGDAADDFRAEILHVTGVDDDGRICLFVIFDPSDHGAAMAALEQSYIAGEGARFAREIGAATRVMTAYHAEDWDTLRATITDDFVLVDHRLASYGELRGADDFIGFTKAMLASVRDRRMTITKIYALGSGRSLAELHIEGTTAEGAAVDLSRLALGVLKGDEIARMEYFPVDQLDAALARFEELKSPPHSLVNAVTRTWDRIVATFEARDWAEHEALYTPDCSGEDRRPGLGVAISGRTQVMEHMRTLADIGVVAIERQTIAIRGERLALGRYVVKGAEAKGGYEVPFLQVTAVDEEGRISGFFVFDPDDVDGAFAELEARYIAGEGAPFAEILRLSIDAVSAWNARDWDRGASSFAADVAFFDHRSISQGQLRGIDHAIAHANELIALVPNLRHEVVAIHAIDVDRLVTHWRAYGENVEGGLVEIEYHNLAVSHAGVIAHIERFDLEQLDAALARFEELEGSGAIDARANEAARRARRLVRRFEQRDWEAVEALLAADAVFEDRRSGLRVRSDGREAVLEMLHTLAAVGVATVDLSLVATRGDRLCLSTALFGGPRDAPGRFEAECLCLHEISAAGEVTATLLFDPDDLDGAFAELEERWVSGEGRTYPALHGLGPRLAAAVQLRDWDAYGECLADDLVAIDHRPISLGERHGRQAELEALRALHDVVPDLSHYILSAPVISERGAVIEVLAKGTTEAGGDVEFRHVGVYIIRDELIARAELFPHDQLDAALARFEEFSATHHDTVPPNAAWQSLADATSAFALGDWDGMAEIPMAADLEVVDRRTGLGATYHGPQAVVEVFRGAASIGIDRYELQLLATRGRSVALGRLIPIWPADVSYEADALIVTEVNEAGENIGATLFDRDELDAAFDELDERYAAGEGNAFVDTVTLLREALRSHRARDWRAYAALMSEDFVFVDHRPASLGRLDRDQLVAAAQQLVEVIPDLRMRMLAIHRIESDRVLVAMVLDGSANDGGTIQVSYLAVGRIRDGRLDAVDYFPLDQLDTAHARFDELGASGPPSIENEASRVAERVIAFAMAGGTSGLDLVSEDVVFDDRRPGVRSVTRGREAMVALGDVVRAVGFRSVDVRCFAVRGDRLALMGMTFRSDDGFEVDVLNVYQLDDTGRVAEWIGFAAEDLDAAFAELDERWLYGDEPTELERLGLRIYAAFNSGDWDEWGSVVCDDLVVIDHRAPGWGRVVGADAYLERVRTGFELVPDRRVRTIRTIGAPDDVGLSEVWIVGTDQYGNAIEWRMFHVGTQRDGRIASIEHFPLERFDDALARANELAQPTTRLENAATRLADQLYRHLERHDAEGLGRVLAADVWAEDRRPGLRWSGRGSEQFIETSRSIDVDEIHCSWIAIRGDRLALGQATYVHTGRFDIDVLYVVETDEARERISAIIAVEPDDLDAAFAELDERYAYGEAAPLAELVRVARVGIAAFNARDWDAYAATFSPDVVFVDHQMVSAGEFMGRDQAVEYAKMMAAELAPNIREYFIADHVFDERGGVWEARARGESTEGAPIEFALLYVGLYEDGLVTRFEFFPAERLDDAIARYHELTQI